MIQLYQNHEIDAYALGAMIVLDYRATPTAELTTAVHRVMRPYAGRQPDGVALLVLVRPTTTGVPDAESRKVTSQVMTELKPFIRLRAGVIEGGGVVTTLLRAFFTSMTALQGDSRTARTFGTLDDAVDWLEPRMREQWPDETWHGVALATAIEAQRAAWNRARPPA